jgi:hypothetical protein
VRGLHCEAASALLRAKSGGYTANMPPPTVSAIALNDAREQREEDSAKEAAEHSTAKQRSTAPASSWRSAAPG